MAKRSNARAAWLAAAAALAVTAGLAVAAPGPAATAAPASAAAAPRPLGSLFAVQTHLAAPGMPATADRARTKDLAVRRSTAAGVAWTRHGNLDWGVAEPTMGRVDWHRIDGIAQDLRIMAAHHLPAQVIVFGAPAWARTVPASPCGPIRPDRYAAFASFLRQVVLRFSAAPYNVHRWELGNEPDHGLLTNGWPLGCWGNPKSPYNGGDAFGRMLKVAYPAIKAADPHAVVTLGGLLMGCGVQGSACGLGDQPGLKFLRGVLAAGAGNSFDVLAYHAYTVWAPSALRHGVRDWDRDAPGRWGSEGGIVLGKLADLRATLGGLRKPIVMDEGALLWCDTSAPTSFCRRAKLTKPGPEYLRDQANYVVRLYARAAAYGLAGASWYTIDHGGWMGSGLVEPDAAMTPRPGYLAYQRFAQALRGAGYGGGTVSLGKREGAPFEDYRFCAGRTETRVLFTNDGARSFMVQVPPGTTAVTDDLGHRRQVVRGAVRVGFAPTIVRRQLGWSCQPGTAARTPSVVTDLTARPRAGRIQQTAYRNGGAGRPGRVWTRTSLDAAGARWSRWVTRTYSAAWGGRLARNAPPTQRIDAVDLWHLPRPASWRQQVYAGGSVWWRDSRNAEGTLWGATWQRRSLASVWGGQPGHPPVDAVDEVTTGPSPLPGKVRQTVMRGGRFWYRDATVTAGGLAFGRWYQPRTLLWAWSGHRNRPAADRVDAYVLERVSVGPGQTRMRQVFVRGESAWVRMSLDAAGTRWPAEWDSRTLAAVWAAGVPAGSRPPVYAG
jgi:hypothetical protein